MKTFFSFVLLGLAAFLWGGYQMFSQWHTAHDESLGRIAQADFASARESVDKFLASKAGWVVEKINLNFLQDYKARLLHSKALASYQMGEKSAEQEFSEAKSASRSSLTKANITYNSTDRALKRNEIEAAISSYKEVLKLNPEDWQAKNNLELLLQKQEESGKGKKKGAGKGGFSDTIGGGGDKRSRLKDLDLFSNFSRPSNKVDK